MCDNNDEVRLFFYEYLSKRENWQIGVGNGSTHLKETHVCRLLLIFCRTQAASNPNFKNSSVNTNIMMHDDSPTEYIAVVILAEIIGESLWSEKIEKFHDLATFSSPWTKCNNTTSQEFFLINFSFIWIQISLLRTLSKTRIVLESWLE